MTPLRLTVCLFLLPACVLGHVYAAEAPPNILLIMADDVGSDAIGCYGGQSYPTPHIDALASQGMRFNHGYAMPVCHPSRICLLTGRYPFRFGADGTRWGDFPKEAERVTIGHRLKEAGYATAVAGKWQLCMMKDDLEHPRRLGFDQWRLFGWHEGGRYHDPLIYENGRLLQNTQGQYGPDLYVAFLVDFMRRQKRVGQPFFAFYSMALCHDVTDDLGDGRVAFYKDERWMTYAEMVASMDDMVGRLMATLDKLELKDNTLVIFTSDNGTAGASYLYIDDSGEMIRTPIVSVRYNKVVSGGKGKHDDTGTRVPLIVRMPSRIAAGTSVDAMVDLTDVLPTLAEIAGVEGQDVPRDGISFAPVLFDQPRERTRAWVFAEHRGKRSIRSMDWRLFDDGQCFNLREDPQEQSALTRDRLPESSRQAIDQLQLELESLSSR